MTHAATLSVPAQPRLDQRILSFAFGACVMYYAWVLTLASGDFQGDSLAYLGIAGRMKEGSFDLGSYNYLRGLAYPWFLSVAWGSNGFWAYFIQAALFLASLWLALRVLALDSLYGLLPIGAAMIPAVAFLQRQIYPDGILISLTLLFLVGLARRRWIACVVLGLILAATKIMFAVLLPLTLAMYLVDRTPVRPGALVRAAVVGLALVPLLAVLAAYVFVDLGYMVIFARPHSHGYAVHNLLPPASLSVRCGGGEHHVPIGELYLDPITVPHPVAPYGPLTRERAAALGCGREDLRALKWQLIQSGFAADPALHIRLAANHLATAVTGGYHVGHVSYILRMRELAWRTHYDQRSYFEPVEIQWLPRLRGDGFEIPAPGPSPLFALAGFSTRAGESMIRWAAFGLLVLSLAVGRRRGLLSQVGRDPANIAIVSFLVAYSGLVSLLGPFVYDRYTYVNLLCLCILAARVAAQTIGTTAGREGEDPPELSRHG